MNGVTVEQMMPTDPTATAWVPYKQWACDLMESCGIVIATGFPRLPLAEPFQPDCTDMKYPPVAGAQ